jgi:hypothetical protein
MQANDALQAFGEAIAEAGVRADARALDVQGARPRTVPLPPRRADRVRRSLPAATRRLPRPHSRHHRHPCRRWRYSRRSKLHHCPSRHRNRNRMPGRATTSIRTPAHLRGRYSPAAACQCLRM